MQIDILNLALELSTVTGEKIADIDRIMLRTKILSMNARLEAARAGDAGRSFAIVAREMGSVADEVNALSATLQAAIGANTTRIEQAGRSMLTGLRGKRLADLARNAVEIIDRNLYERSCDVRWWATDSAVVDVLERPSADARAHACDRLATILRSYTVYLDLWVTDAGGRVVATGRGDRYGDAIGCDVAASDWFRAGLATRDGDSFAVCDIAANAALGGAKVATYATAIRADGAVDGRPLGVLGIFFDWAPQAAAIVEGVSLADEERAVSKVMLLDAAHRVIASSDTSQIGQVYPLKATSAWGHYVDGDRLVAYGVTPGYETYRGLGWYGCIESPADA